MKTQRKSRMLFAMFITVAATLLVTLLFLRFRFVEKQIRYELTHLVATGDPQFARNMRPLLGPSLMAGNRIQAVHNGDEIFSAMLEAIRGARETVTLENDIYWSADVGQHFSRALCDRTQAGVGLHVLLDWVGTGRIDTNYLDDLSAAGVEVERYHPLHWFDLTRINNRTHRKLLIVDGRIGFTGGVRIADLWSGHAQCQDQPGPHTDAPIVQRTRRPLWGQLLDAGRESNQYQPTMYHCKVIIVDVGWVSVASTNFDDCPSLLNDGANLTVFDVAFAAEQIQVLEEDRGKSRLMTRAEFKNRCAHITTFDEFAGTFRPRL